MRRWSSKRAAQKVDRGAWVRGCLVLEHPGLQLQDPTVKEDPAEV